MKLLETEREILHGHLFCGIGGGAIGFNKGHARVGNVRAKFVCVGGIDVDAASCRDFAVNVGVPASCVDLFTREQYRAFHGKEPPKGWREAGVGDVHAAFGGRRPNIVFLSAPCKGFSGLLSERSSATAKYQALNGLTLRGVRLLLEAYESDPVEAVIFENVPRIMTRGRPLLDQIEDLFEAFGYVANETTHDCGELGNLAQSRKRFLLVARHKDKVPSFIYEPDKHKLRGVGEVLDKLPMPLSGLGGPMHRMPRLHWKTWVRLAFVRAGGDWRSLNELEVEDGFLKDYGIVPGTDWYGGALGVNEWDKPMGVVTSRSTPSTGKFAVADPRPPSGAYGERANGGIGQWDSPAATITSQRSPLQGRYAVADPRIEGKRFSSTFRIVKWDQAAPAVTGPGGAGGQAVADPRGFGPDTKKNVMRVTGYDEPAGTITSGHSPSNGAGSVADPRVNGRARSTQLGVKRWDDTAGVVAGESMPTNGAFSVADPRPPQRDDYKSTKYRVTKMDEPSGAVIGASTTGNGAFAVADPRTTHGPNAHTSKHRVTPWDESSGAVTGTDRVGSGALCVADPRCNGYSPVAHRNKLKVTGWDEPACTVTSGKHVQSGGLSVADNRAADRYGVLRYDQPARAVVGHGSHDNGYNSVADPRPENEPPNITENITAALPGPSDRLVAVIFALDGTWHRPFTTLELAALQGLVDPEEKFELDGLSDASWRERIGNCVPPPSAQAIAGVMGEALLLAWQGETFTLSSSPIWVRDIAVALSVKPQDLAFGEKH